MGDGDLIGQCTHIKKGHSFSWTFERISHPIQKLTQPFVGNYSSSNPHTMELACYQIERNVELSNF